MLVLKMLVAVLGLTKVPNSCDLQYRLTQITDSSEHQTKNCLVFIGYLSCDNADHLKTGPVFKCSFEIWSSIQMAI